MKTPPGVTSQKILLKSEPTKARIYVNDVYIGKTPIKTTIWYEKEKFVNIKAEPIYPNQFPQNIFLKIPPIPPKLTIYMNYDKRKYMMEEQAEFEEEAFVPEKIIEKEYITQEIPVELPIIYFQSDQFDLNEESMNKLEKLSEILKENPDYNLSIHAHADERGEAEYNYRLSYQRGVAVKSALAEMGIEPERMEIFIHGEQKVFLESQELMELENSRTVDFQINKRQ
jgi:outer membrane protein OmpA-like peptidoglycan-associated protein